jgi:hypothetical protein
MENAEFKIGDKIFHLSNSSVAWVIEKIENDLVTCSTLMRGTLEYRKENFSITSIKKAADKTPIAIIPIRRRDY